MGPCWCLWSQTRLPTNRRQQRLWQRLQGGKETGLQQQRTQKCMVRSCWQQRRRWVTQETQRTVQMCVLPVTELGSHEVNQCIMVDCFHTSRPKEDYVSTLHTMLRPCCAMSQERAAAVWTKWSTEWINEQYQPGTMERLKGWWTAKCVCQDGLDPPKRWSHSQPCRPDSSVLKGTTETSETGAVQAPSSTVLKPWSWDSQLSFLKLTPDQQDANYHHLLVFLFFFFNYQNCWKDCHFEMSQVYKKEKCIYLFFFSLSEIWLSWMSVPKSSVVYEKWSLPLSASWCWERTSLL